MATAIQGLPAGATLQPITPAQPAIEGLPAGATLQPITPPSSTQPPAAAAAGPGVFRQMLSATGDDLAGMGKSALDSVAGMAQLGHNAGEWIHPGLGEYGASQASIDAARKAAQASTPEQQQMKDITDVASFFLPENAMVKTPEELMKLAPLVQRLEKSPALLQIAKNSVGAARKLAGQTTAATAARQAILGGGAAAASNEDAGTVGTDAAESAALAAVTHGGSRLLAKGIQAVEPQVRRIGGMDAPVLAGQQQGAGKLARTAATIGDAPKIAARQQQVGQQALQNVAQDATRNALIRANALRAPRGVLENPERLLAAPEDMQPYSFELQTGPTATEAPESERMAYPADRQQIGGMQYSQGADGAMVENPAGRVPRGDEEPGTYQYLTGILPGNAPGELAQPAVRGGGTIRTTDPAVAQQHLSAMREMYAATSEPQLGAAADRLEQQLKLYHQAKNAGDRFSPHDVEQIASQVHSFGDGRDQLEAAAAPIFHTLDKASDGDFQMYRNAEKTAQQAVRDAGTKEDRAEANRNLSAARTGMEQVFRSVRDKIVQGGTRTPVTPGDLAAAKSLWTDKSGLDTVDTHVERMFNGDPADLADSDPDVFQRKITKANTQIVKKLETKLGGPDELQRLIGEDGRKTLYDVNALLSDQAHAPAAQTFAKQIGQYAQQHAIHLGTATILGGIGGQVLGVGYKEGAEAGAGVGLSGAVGRAVLRKIATTPQAFKMFDYAVRQKVNPKLAIPLITGMLSQKQRNQ